VTDENMFPLTVAVNVGVAVLLCYVIAWKRKRSRWWAFAGLLHVWGILLVVCLPGERRAPATDETPARPRTWYEGLGNIVARLGAGETRLTWFSAVAIPVGVSMFILAFVGMLTDAGSVSVNGEVVEPPGQRMAVLLTIMAVGALVGAGGILYLRFVWPAARRAMGEGQLERLRRRKHK